MYYKENIHIITSSGTSLSIPYFNQSSGKIVINKCKHMLLQCSGVVLGQDLRLSESSEDDSD